MSEERKRRDFLKLTGAGMMIAGVTLGASTTAQAAPSRANSPSGNSFDVKAFGATGDGKTLDTPAIDKAIDAAAASGGGVVRFPAGNYLCFSIHLKSHITLYLDPGATIVAADTPAVRRQATIRPNPMPGTTFRTSATAIGTTA